MRYKLGKYYVDHVHALRMEKIRVGVVKHDFEVVKQLKKLEPGKVALKTQIYA